MISQHQLPLRVAVACGGTGGHLFPGIAVADRLLDRGCAVTLIISPKEIDRQSVRNISGMDIVTLPAIGLTRGQLLAFCRAFWQSYRIARKQFRAARPRAVLAMGGFTAAAPLLAGKRSGADTFLHESNTIPGRANRWLARVVDAAFIGFPSAAQRLPNRHVTVTGTPVRRNFSERDPSACRRALGLDPDVPVMLVLGGSQGAHGVNELVTRSLPHLPESLRRWRWLHLTGAADVEQVRGAYAAANLRASVHPFLAEIDLAMGAATVAISRAGASSLAELAAVRLPAILVPYPAATDNHQFHNARAFVDTGAALMLEQQTGTPQALATMLAHLAQNSATREKMRTALGAWHKPDAAETIAALILEKMNVAVRQAAERRPGEEKPSSGGDTDSRQLLLAHTGTCAGVPDLSSPNLSR